MKKYYVLTVQNDIEFLGNFENFSEAWDFLNYESNKRFVWLISDQNLLSLHTKIGILL